VVTPGVVAALVIDRRRVGRREAAAQALAAFERSASQRGCATESNDRGAFQGGARRWGGPRSEAIMHAAQPCPPCSLRPPTHDRRGSDILRAPALLGGAVTRWLTQASRGRLRRSRPCAHGPVHVEPVVMALGNFASILGVVDRPPLLLGARRFHAGHELVVEVDSSVTLRHDRHGADVWMIMRSLPLTVVMKPPSSTASPCRSIGTLDLPAPVGYRRHRFLTRPRRRRSSPRFRSSVARTRRATFSLAWLSSS
jgi:hypothetical protein